MTLVTAQELSFNGTTIVHTVTTPIATLSRIFNPQEEQRWVKFSPAIATGETVSYGSIAEKMETYKKLSNPLNSMDAQPNDWIELLLQRFDTPNCNELFTSHHRGEGWINDAKGGRVKTAIGIKANCDLDFAMPRALPVSYTHLTLPTKRIV